MALFASLNYFLKWVFLQCIGKNLAAMFFHYSVFLFKYITEDQEIDNVIIFEKWFPSLIAKIWIPPPPPPPQTISMGKYAGGRGEEVSAV